MILKGVSTEEEENYQLGLACEKIQAQLDQKEAEEIVSRMIFDLIRGIRTPERFVICVIEILFVSQSRVDDPSYAVSLFYKEGAFLCLDHEVFSGKFTLSLKKLSIQKLGHRNVVAKK